ncbi:MULTISPECIES: hypothetical protein [Ensifer]|nr:MULTISPECIES: hypothetical protein [Ensifer]
MPRLHGCSGRQLLAFTLPLDFGRGGGGFIRIRIGPGVWHPA